MARRRIGQGPPAVGEASARSSTSLDEVAALVDWMEFDRLIAAVSASVKAEASWPSLALFRALLLATRHDLLDVRPAEALDDRVEWGVWGGLTERERRALLRQRPDVTSWHSFLMAEAADQAAEPQAPSTGTGRRRHLVPARKAAGSRSW